MFKRLESQLANIVGAVGIMFTVLYSLYVDANAITYLVA